jgi:hypothetical protein
MQAFEVLLFASAARELQVCNPQTQKVLSVRALFLTQGVDEEVQGACPIAPPRA